MGIENWTEDIILVNLLQEPKLRDELQTVLEMVYDRDKYDVIIDFSSVDIVTSFSMSMLIKLHKKLSDNGHKLIFCNVAVATKRIFLIIGLEWMSKIFDDKFVALKSLQKESQQDLSVESQEVPPEASRELPLKKLWERNVKIKQAIL